MIESENKELLERGLEFLLNLKNSETMRVHNHLIKCIKNRDLENAKFEPNLEAEFDGRGTTLMKINVGDILEWFIIYLLKYRYLNISTQSTK